MPVITVSMDELSRLSNTEPEDLLHLLPKMAVEVDNKKGDELWLEVYPDRCDMLSVEGIARAIRGYKNMETGVPTYEVKGSDVVTEVELSVQEVRPYIVTAVIENVDLNDEILKSLMDVQEKIHLTLGRGREKVAIGVHDLSTVKPPFVYKAVNPLTTSFIPLGYVKEMTLEDILKDHEKGQEYAHLLDGKDRYPLIMDSDENVLSFPPIINGELTEVNTESTRLFVDMTGTELKALEQSLNILCTMFAERGANIYRTTVKYGQKEREYPQLSPLEINISIQESKKLLGVDLSLDEIKSILGRMRYDIKEVHEDTISLNYPAYRHDIIHPWDVIEDMAVAYGYDRFVGELPSEPTFGKPLSSKKTEEAFTELMVGYGFNEVMNFTLSNPEKEFHKMELAETDDFVEIENPVNEESSCLRVWLLPSLMEDLKENRKNPLPQKLFELGDVVEKYNQKTRAAGVIFGPDAGFSKMKSLVDGLTRSMGIGSVIEVKGHPSFIEGRCASVIADEEEIGFFGEIHPKVLSNFELEYPVAAFELYMEKVEKILRSRDTR